MPRGQYPRTPAQWQQAVDLAWGCLMIDSARQYGLVTGGPEINAARCEELLARGKAKGFAPNEERALADLVAAINEPR